MDLSGFNPPDYRLIDADPLTFGQQFQSFIEALTAHQAEAGDLERVNADLHAALETATGQLQEAQQLVQQHQEAAAAMRAQHDLAVTAYRQALLDGDASVPPDLVQGQTVEEIDAALQRARAVVEYVREKVATPGGAGSAGVTALPIAPRVPGAAPGRTLPDTSGMTAREKLIFGTQRAAG